MQHLIMRSGSEVILKSVTNYCSSVLSILKS